MIRNQNTQSVNLWSVMTNAQSDRYDFADKDSILELLQSCGSNHSFATEVSMAVDQNGTWEVRLHNHEEPFNEVSLQVFNDGSVRVERSHDVGKGIHDRRVINF